MITKDGRLVIDTSLAVVETLDQGRPHRYRVLYGGERGSKELGGGSDASGALLWEEDPYFVCAGVSEEY